MATGALKYAQILVYVGVLEPIPQVYQGYTVVGYMLTFCIILCIITKNEKCMISFLLHSDVTIALRTIIEDSKLVCLNLGRNVNFHMPSVMMIKKFPSNTGPPTQPVLKLQLSNTLVT